MEFQEIGKLTGLDEIGNLSVFTLKRNEGFIVLDHSVRVEVDDMIVPLIVVFFAYIIEVGTKSLIGSRAQKIDLHAELRLIDELYQRPGDGSIINIPLFVWTCRDDEDIEGRGRPDCIPVRNWFKILPHHRGFQRKWLGKIGIFQRLPVNGMKRR